MACCCCPCVTGQSIGCWDGRRPGRRFQLWSGRWPRVGASKSALCLLCRVVSQIPLQRLVTNKLATSPSTGKLRGNVCNGFWALSIFFQQLLIFTPKIDGRSRKRYWQCLQELVKFYLRLCSVSYCCDTSSRNFYQKPAPMHVTKIVRFAWSAVFESFRWQQLVPNRAAYEFLGQVSSARLVKYTNISASL